MKGEEIFKNGKSLILAYDQGFEHGPSMDFNLKNVDPKFIFDIALEGNYDAVAVQSGIARKYYKDNYRDIPLIVKLNGKTRFDNDDPVSRQHTSVEEAVRLGASAVGYTIYLGSSKEQDMFVEFGKICEDAHKHGIYSVCWMYPRGPSIHDELSTDVLSYGARIAMELGADVVKIKYNGDSEAMKWIVRSAGEAKVVVAGGSKTSDQEFLKMAKETMKAGAVGLAVGRNVWQNKSPLKISRELRHIYHNSNI